MAIWGCKRCEKTRQVRWFEESEYKKVGWYLCRDCKAYERSLEHIAFEIHSILKKGVNSTVKRSLEIMRKELDKLRG